MSEEPTRWRDDPAHDPGLGTLDALYQGYALPGVPRGPRALPWWRGWVGGGVGVAAALLAAWWAWPVAPAPVVVAVPEVAASAPPPPPAPGVAQVPVASAPVDPPRPARSVPPPTPSAPTTPPGQADVVEPEPPGSQPTYAAGTLEAELGAIGFARERLEEADHARALSAFDGYLASWPDGRFIEEAHLGRLDSLVGLGRWSEVAALAAELLGAGDVAVGRRPVIEGVRARALVRDGRCGEALALLGSLDKADQAEVRKACR